MANNLGIIVGAWLWHLWTLLRSLASFATLKPKLPFSSSQPELETGLYSSRADRKQPRKHPDRVHLPRTGSPPPSSSLQNFRFTFEASPSQQSSAPPQKEFLPHPSLELKTKPSRRGKRSRESMERKRLRRIARVSDFSPPPEIHVEDWSVLNGKCDAQSDSERKPPRIFVFGSGLNSAAPPLDAPYPVPSVIITPSTPSEENASRRSSGLSFTSSLKSSSTDATTNTVLPANETPSSSEILRDLGHVRGSDSPAPTTESPFETVEAETSSEPEHFCHTARLSVHLSDDSSASGSVKDTKSPEEGRFVFSDSLTKIAFGPSQQSPTISPADYGFMDQPQVAIVVSHWEDPSFQISSSSTPRLGDRPGADKEAQPDADAKPVLINRHSQSLGSRNSVYDMLPRNPSVPVDDDNHDPDLSLGVDGQARYSVLPYPDIFDFDMYTGDLHASMAAFGISPGDDLVDELAVEAYKRLSRPNGTSESIATSHAHTQMKDSEGNDSISRDYHHRHLPSTSDSSVGGGPPPPSGVRPPTLTHFRFSLPIIGIGIGMEDIQTRDSVEDAFARSTPMASFVDSSGTRTIMSEGRLKLADDHDIEYSCEDAIARATAATAATRRGEYAISAQFQFPISAPSISRTPPATVTVRKASDEDLSSESSPDVFSSTRGSGANRVVARASSLTESFSNNNKSPSHRDSAKNPSLPSTAPSPSKDQVFTQRRSDSRTGDQHRSAQLDNEIKRYEDHYRHPAYSRSPPLPGKAFSTSSSYSSESKYQDSVSGSLSRDSVPLPPPTSSTTLPRSSSLSLSSSETVTALVSSSTAMRADSGRKGSPPAEVGVHENRSLADSRSLPTVVTTVGQSESPGERGVRRVPLFRLPKTRRPLKVVNSNEIFNAGNSGGGGGGGPTAEGDLDSGGVDSGGSGNIKNRLQQQKQVVVGGPVSDAVRGMIRKVSMKRKLNYGLSKSVDLKVLENERVDQGHWNSEHDHDTIVAGGSASGSARVGGLKRSATVTRRRAGSTATTTSGRTINLLREVNRQEEKRRAGILSSSDTMNNMTLESVRVAVD
ncbi:hypothetical protein EST38_g6046 [Candolleomyces aberdarensis]|uniref:Uncharacterized protein n=1 Tax=Candolleomyces aberdarensis TaxID=2316362 RepID=A0A4Q2DIX7_9AGAR|nr:hypothetical protein EST38_g6046 [Candolleomyces aberdarensis]